MLFVTINHNCLSSLNMKEQSEEIRRLQLANDELCERNRILSTTQEDTSVLQEKLRSANAKIKRLEERLQGNRGQS